MRMAVKEFDRVIGRVKATPSKYHAALTEIDGIRFHSKREARHYAELRLREKAGEVRQVRLQVPMELEAGGKKLGVYVADFVYEERDDQDWCVRVDEVKGYDVPLGKWKRRHAEAQYGVTIRVIR